MRFFYLPICRNLLTCLRFAALTSISNCFCAKHRATRNRESLRSACFCDAAPAETDGAFKTNTEWPKGPADHPGVTAKPQSDVTRRQSAPAHRRVNFITLSLRSFDGSI